MERRRFLRSITLSTTLAVLPFAFLDKVLANGSAAEVIPVGNTCGIANISQPWSIDYATKTIIYKGGWEDNGISLPDLYNYLKNEWDTDQAEFPMEKRGEHTYHVKELNLLTKNG